MKVFLAGPIDYWWNENWETPAHIAYMEWRDKVNAMLVESGHLVYRPHQAIKGAWPKDEADSYQAVNDLAIYLSDVVIVLTPPGVPAYGTAAETALARTWGKQVRYAPPGDTSDILDLIDILDDPYSDIHRKSYSKK